MDDRTDTHHENEDGLIRQMFIISTAHKEKLKQLAKSYKLTQGEIIEILLDHVDLSVMEARFEARRAEKVATRRARKPDLLRLIRSDESLSPEKRAAIEAILRGQLA